ncbi:hypothetical protein ACTWP4_00335 [Gracilibacillus sp. D59]
MKIANRSKDDQKKQLKKMDKISERDLKELMGINRDTYKKVNGGEDNDS